MTPTGRRYLRCPDTRPRTRPSKRTVVTMTGGGAFDEVDAPTVADALASARLCQWDLDVTFPDGTECRVRRGVTAWTFPDPFPWPWRDEDETEANQ